MVNKIILSLLCYTIIVPYLYSQESPKVPNSLRIDNIVLNIKPEAKEIIQIEVDALHANEKYFQIFIDRIQIYFPIIERILEEENVPDDLKYLSVQESALIPDAVSSSNAVGFWQFKSETGKDYGLSINDDVDERKNIISSTRAAARYIKNSNFVFENWIFSILSYLEGLSGAKLKVDPNLYGAKRLDIGEETHWYIIKFLAHKVAFQDYIDENKFDRNYSIYTNQIFKNIRDISSELSIDYKKLKDLNKWIQTDEIPNDKEYSFLIPTDLNYLKEKISSFDFDKVKDFVESKITSSIDLKIKNILSNRTIFLNNLPAIIIDSSDNIEQIVNVYDISKKLFITYNNVDNNHKLVPGLPYYLSKKKKRGKVESYYKSDEEDLWHISQLFGVQLKRLKKINKGNQTNRILLRRRFNLL